MIGWWWNSTRNRGPSLCLQTISSKDSLLKLVSVGKGSRGILTTTLATSNKIPELQAYISNSTNPWFNLSFEDHLLRTRDAETPVCLIYRNSPCVVIGRNQNPWKELDCSAMRQAQIPLVRRRSGGGTVYHDLGNTNYSFHIGRQHFERSTHSELVVRALNTAPISLPSSTVGIAATTGAYVNARNDICIRVRPGFDGKSTEKTRAEAVDGLEERKISGSAYKLVNSRAYHHGTMLLSASLQRLGSSLHNTRGEALVTKGVASVPAPVANLSEAFPDRKENLHHDIFAQAVVDEFKRTYGGQGKQPNQILVKRIDESMLDHPEFNQGRWKLREEYEELRSWYWVFGQTPEFTHRIRRYRHDTETRTQEIGDEMVIEIHSKEGIILDASLVELHGEHDPKQIRQLEIALETLKGNRYDEYATTPPWAHDMADNSSISVKPNDQVQRRLFEWLKGVL